MWSSNSSLSSRKRKRIKSNRSVKSEFQFEKDGRPTSLWYWSNYVKALMWQHKHEVALWKSYASALEHERTFLLQELYKLGSMSNTSERISQNQVSSDESEESETEEDESNEDEDEDEEIEFVMSEEMIKFFEQSFKHKLEMKKMKEKEVDQFELHVNELKEARELREKEMKLLYGEGSCMIIGMETAVQLSFDKYCDLKSPKYWPNIPLKL